MKSPVQLPLGLQLRDDVDFSNFYTGENNTLVALLNKEQAQSIQLEEQSIYIYGDPCSGRTHLLQAACRQVDRLGGYSMYLPMSDLVDYDPRVLDNIERLQLVCLDDIDTISGKVEWEEAVFNLFNRLREAKTHLVVAASHAPNKIALQLPDLVSRLTWGPVFRVYALTNHEQIIVLKKRASYRGITISDEVARYIVDRNKRHMTDIIKALNTLDKACLREKRKLTIPFAKEVMGW